MTKTLLIKLIMSMSLEQGINPNISLAIVEVESKFNLSAIGPVGEIGLFQVRPEYSKYSRKELFNYEINIKEGLRIIKTSMDRCKHQTNNEWLVCYNAGIRGGSNIKYPKNFIYYKKVQNVYLKNKAKDYRSIASYEIK